MAEIENSKDLISVLWSGADILRSKMDANEYKDYLIGIVFYKYLSYYFLIFMYSVKFWHNFSFYFNYKLSMLRYYNPLCFFQ